MSFGSDNDFAPNKEEALIWTIDGLFTGKHAMHLPASTN